MRLIDEQFPETLDVGLPYCCCAGSFGSVWQACDIQGSQFTSLEFTQVLKDAGVKKLGAIDRVTIQKVKTIIIEMPVD